ncbi:MAG: hypothetical protein NC131_03130 [Roseburia sp.]|nr:hypothetical protein [Roseburia sp.]
MKVAIVGRKGIEITERLKEAINREISRLVQDGADVFYFCDIEDGFGNLCYDALEKYNVRRVLVRAYYEMLDEDTAEYKIEFTENKFFPEDLQDYLTVYIKPEKHIISLCNVLLTCCKVSCDYYFKDKSQAGSLLAVLYARRKGKKIINIYDML